MDAASWRDTSVRIAPESCIPLRRDGLRRLKVTSRADFSRERLLSQPSDD